MLERSYRYSGPAAKRFASMQNIRQKETSELDTFDKTFKRLCESTGNIIPCFGVQLQFDAVIAPLTGASVIAPCRHYKPSGNTDDYFFGEFVRKEKRGFPWQKALVSVSKQCAWLEEVVSHKMSKSWLQRAEIENVRARQKRKDQLSEAIGYQYLCIKYVALTRLAKNERQKKSRKLDRNWFGYLTAEYGSSATEELLKAHILCVTGKESKVVPRNRVNNV